MKAEKYICENAMSCNEKCDGTDPKHNKPHSRNIFCREAKCLQTGINVKCVKAVSNES